MGFAHIYLYMYKFNLLLKFAQQTPNLIQGLEELKFDFRSLASSDQTIVLQKIKSKVETGHIPQQIELLYEVLIELHHTQNENPDYELDSCDNPESRESDLDNNPDNPYAVNLRC